MPVNKENITPANTAVASPAKDPINNIGIPIVITISQNIEVFFNLLFPRALYSIIYAPKAVANAKNSIPTTLP